VLDARRGAVLDTVVVGGNPGPATVDEQRGRVFVLDAPADGDGRLRLLDAGTGALRRTIPVGMDPRAVAVDERTGYAYVLNAGGSVRGHGVWWGWWAQGLWRWLPWLPQPVSVIHTEPGSVSVIDAARL
jgi:DNA-binding beta-propeller fold protein YncE